MFQIFSQLQNWEPGEGDDQLRLAFSLVKVIFKYTIEEEFQKEQAL